MRPWYQIVGPDGVVYDESHEFGRLKATLAYGFVLASQSGFPCGLTRLPDGCRIVKAPELEPVR